MSSNYLNSVSGNKADGHEEAGENSPQVFIDVRLQDPPDGEEVCDQMEADHRRQGPAVVRRDQIHHEHTEDDVNEKVPKA